jgi:hypothetical protein
MKIWWKGLASLDADRLEDVNGSTTLKAEACLVFHEGTESIVNLSAAVHDLCRMQEVAGG